MTRRSWLTACSYPKPAFKRTGDKHGGTRELPYDQLII